MPKGAKWIWSEPGAEKKALAEWVYFRKTFNLREVPEEAVAVVACDNSFTLVCEWHEGDLGQRFRATESGVDPALSERRVKT